MPDIALMAAITPDHCVVGEPHLFSLLLKMLFIVFTSTRSLPALHSSLTKLLLSNSVLIE